MSVLEQPTRPRLNPVDDTQSRFEAFADTHDPGLRETLLTEHLPLARRLATRYGNRGEPVDDLVQVAALGLIKAIERYDPYRGSTFTSYAVPTILGELRRHFRDAGWALSVPRGLKELRQRAISTAETLTSELGRAATAAEIAAEINVDVDQLLQAMQLSSAYRPDALERPARGDADGTSTVVDMLGHADSRLATIEDRDEVRVLVAELPERQRHVLYLYYYHELSQAEIGSRLGISQVHVSRLLASSRKRLRARAS